MVFRTELADVRCENVLPRDQLRRAEAAKGSPPTLDERLKSRHFSVYDIDKLLQANAQATVRLTVETLRDAKLLREDGPIKSLLLIYNLRYVHKSPPLHRSASSAAAARIFTDGTSAQHISPPINSFAILNRSDDNQNPKAIMRENNYHV
ncbi:hypothetical protein KSP39_PZI018063 [Platanthera zijinensis]|uniref:Uncharacterized protein n=1 Tax=Platanthera zijinensis TaxID=2320716 RepID=A0AAP0B382_9ASPA